MILDTNSGSIAYSGPYRFLYHQQCRLPGKPAACYYGLRSVHHGLLCGIVACSFLDLQVLLDVHGSTHLDQLGKALSTPAFGCIHDR